MEKKGKYITMLVVVLIIVSVGVTASLLDYFGQNSTTVNVARAVTVEGVSCLDNVCSNEVDVSGGESSYSENITLVSDTSANAPLTIDFMVTPNDAGIVNTLIYNLEVSGDAGNENRIRIDASDVASVTTLSDINTMSFDQYVTAGYIGHVDILLDINGDGEYTSGIDDALVFEYDKVSAPSDQVVASMGYSTGSWVNTFDDKGVIDDNAKAWLTTGPAGPASAPATTFFSHTLGDWKVGPATNEANGKTIDGSTVVLGFEIEVDNWIVDSSTRISDVMINSVGVDDFVLQGNQELGFQIETEFPIASVGAYTVDSEVVIR